MKNFVISYDISDDAKRTKIATLLEDFGDRVQYSVFECHLDDNHLEQLLFKLKPLVDTTDSVRVYRLCRRCLTKVITIGGKGQSEEPGFFLV